MPLYDYACRNCGQIQEVEAPIRDTEAQVSRRLTFSRCGSAGWTESGEPKFKRLITGSSFSLKGQGWSRDGYR